jgi:hypothetical protein
MSELQRLFWMIDAISKWPHPDPVLQQMRLRELVTQFYAAATVQS